MQDGHSEGHVDVVAVRARLGRRNRAARAVDSRAEERRTTVSEPTVTPSKRKRKTLRANRQSGNVVNDARPSSDAAILQNVRFLAGGPAAVVLQSVNQVVDQVAGQVTDQVADQAADQVLQSVDEVAGSL